MNVLLRCLAVCLLLALPAKALERVKFNHPGLTVDLGVGLWAWPVPVDAHGDGKFDLYVACPDKPFNGVWQFANPGVDTARNPFPVFPAARRLSQAVHYVMPSYVNGRVRVLSPATEYPDFLTAGLAKALKLDLPTHPHKQLVNPKATKGPRIRHNQWRYVDYDGDGALDLVVGVEDWSDYGWDDAWDRAGKWTNGPLHGFVYWLKNLGTTAQPRYDTPRKVEAGGVPVDVFGCPSPNFADFTGSGKLDVICGEFLDGFTFFENIGTRTQPRYAPGRRLKLPDGQPLSMDLEMIVPVAFDWNKDGHPDLIVGDEDGRVALLLNTGKLSADRTPQFLPPRYFQQGADDLKCGALATPVGVDWDGDGDTDIICGNTAGYLVYFENLSGPGVEQPKWAAPKLLEADGKVIRFMAGPNGSIQGPAEAKWGYTTLSVADWDGDGLPDLIVNSIWGKVVWFKNIGTRKAPKLAAAQPIEVEWTGPPPTLAWGWLRPQGNELLTQWRTTPFAVDWNRDGLTDLVMLDTEGYLAFYERAKRDGKLVLLPPQRIFCDEQGQPLRLNAGTAGKSGRRKLCVVDWDGDGKLDLLLNGENANFLRQVDARDGKFFFKDMGKLADKNVASHDVSPTVVDWNGDGIPDLLAGAEDGHLYYLRNSRKAKQPPVK
ncbi:MAG: VCBS repeat-containing protein [Proteobacteria bacterium]|nr:VCBS repeat-containing protein [Pseudomonadota bacterium]